MLGKMIQAVQGATCTRPTGGMSVPDPRVCRACGEPLPYGHRRGSVFHDLACYETDLWQRSALVIAATANGRDPDDYLMEELERHGTVAAVATSLGVDNSTVGRWCKRLGLRRGWVLPGELRRLRTEIDRLRSALREIADKAGQSKHGALARAALEPKR